MLFLLFIAELQLRTFRPANSSYYTARAIGMPQQVASLLDCARVCNNEYSDCFSITFSIKSGACTPLIAYHPKSSPVTPSEDVFYHTGRCNTTGGFQLYMIESVIQCLYISTDVTNFTSARAVCQAKDSRLFQIKSRDKLNLMRQLVESVTRMSTWIGLSDLLREGRYVWEDGEPAEKVSFPIPWNVGQPDNLWNNEDCVEIGYTTKQFVNDINCSMLLKFICEKDILS
ncbi:unnamed protein product [Candidula unifasciata]|uniref:C-type lectin domain-containing protein n=1 Tax=Candidula unifasciata TaxID=100452 RepID=A0A8S4ACZ6_9EUPU|nr:unnamed protein product [Candidula unifasciata]